MPSEEVLTTGEPLTTEAPDVTPETIIKRLRERQHSFLLDVLPDRAPKGRAFNAERHMLFLRMRDQMERLGQFQPNGAPQLWTADQAEEAIVAVGDELGKYPRKGSVYLLDRDLLSGDHYAARLSAKEQRKLTKWGDRLRDLYRFNPMTRFILDEERRLTKMGPALTQEDRLARDARLQRIATGKPRESKK